LGFGEEIFDSGLVEVPVKLRATESGNLRNHDQEACFSVMILS